MENINLRAYYREIDNLIAAGQFPQAIEHCQYLLMTFPKNFEVYRLLGKASLENKDLTQATDAFERALAVRPDDFIANVGMSCIREEEGNLDAAIWHMERAFEMNSATPAIQGELKRLYTLRDGQSPQKIRLTKGALIRLHAQSGMLQQAISEIQTQFAPNEERPDIQVLLATLLFQAGQKSAAVDISRALIKNLPYCFDANYILLNSLNTPSDDAEAAIYRDRLIELDPYFARITDVGQDVSMVPDDAIILRKYDSQMPAGEAVVVTPPLEEAVQPPAQPPAPEEPAEPPAQPEAKVEQPVESEPDTKMPDWFHEESQALQQTEPEPASNPQRADMPAADAPQESEQPSPVISQNGTDMVHMEAESTPAATPDQTVNEARDAAPSEALFSDVDLPDWMKEMEWKPETPPNDLNAREAQPKPVENVLPADIPEWVQGMAPILPETPEEPASDLAEKTDLSDILFTGMENQQISIEDVITDSTPPSTDADEGEAPAAQQPQAEESSSIPDWLQGFEPTASAPEEKPTETPAETSLPDWLGADEIASSSENKPFTLDTFSDLNLDAAKPEVDDEEFPGTAPLAEDSVTDYEKPEWLREETQTDAEIDAHYASSSNSVEPSQDFSNWLDTLRPTSETAAPESDTQPEPAKDDNALPAWLNEPEPPVQMGDTEPVAVNRSTPPAEDNSWMETIVGPEPEGETLEVQESVPSMSSDSPDLMSDMPDFFASEEKKKDTEPIKEEAPSFELPSESEEVPAAPASVSEPTFPREKESVASLIEYYNLQLSQGHNLPGMIEELKKLTEEHPAEPGIWLILGDAYHHNQQIQAALDAYSRAEEFLR